MSDFIARVPKHEATQFSELLRLNARSAELFNQGQAATFELACLDDAALLRRTRGLVSAAGDLGFELEAPRDAAHVSEVFEKYTSRPRGQMYEFGSRFASCKHSLLDIKWDTSLFYVDWTRCAFYEGVNLVADTITAMVSYVSYFRKARQIHSQYSYVFNLVKYAPNSVFYHYLSHVSYTGSPQLEPFWNTTTDTLSKRPVYTYDVIGYELPSVMHALVSYKGLDLSVVSAGTKVVVSNLCRPTESALNSFKAGRRSLGRTGAFYGMIPPVDADGRAVVVMPVGRFALPNKKGVERMPTLDIARAIDKLTHVLTGKHPVWLTPAGRCSVDQLV